MKTIIDTYKDSMEMPCMCDCGEWFDLNDGYRSNKANKLICRDCHYYEERDNEIKTVGYNLQDEHISFSEARKELKRLGVGSIHLKSKTAIISFCDNL